MAKTVFELQDGKLILSLSGDGRSLSEKVSIPPSESITAMWCEFRADDTQPTEVYLLETSDRKMQQSKPSSRT